MKEEVKTTLRIDKTIHKKLKKFCVDKEISFQEFAISSMLHFMDKDTLPQKKDV